MYGTCAAPLGRLLLLCLVSDLILLRASSLFTEKVQLELFEYRGVYTPRLLSLGVSACV